MTEQFAEGLVAMYTRIYDGVDPQASEQVGDRLIIGANANVFPGAPAGAVVLVITDMPVAEQAGDEPDSESSGLERGGL